MATTKEHVCKEAHHSDDCVFGGDDCDDTGCCIGMCYLCVMEMPATHPSAAIAHGRAVSPKKTTGVPGYKIRSGTSQSARGCLSDLGKFYRQVLFVVVCMDIALLKKLKDLSYGTIYERQSLKNVSATESVRHFWLTGNQC